MKKLKWSNDMEEKAKEWAKTFRGGIEKVHFLGNGETREGDKC